MQKGLDQIRQMISLCADTYRDACALKESARTQKENPDLWLATSEKLQIASDLSKKISKHPNIPELKKLEAAIYAEYYAYEMEDCIVSYYYTKHLVTEAKSHFSEASIHLSNTITLIKDSLPKFTGEARKKFTYELDLYSYFSRKRDIEVASLDARIWWDNKKYIKAMDFYRQMAVKYEELLQNFPTNIPPEYYRIAKANYFGIMANISASFAQTVIQNADSTEGADAKIISHELAVELLTHTLNAYKLGISAYRTNPEWKEYWEGAQICRTHIENFLRSNPSSWLALLVAFNGDDTIIQMMRNVDEQHFMNTVSLNKNTSDQKSDEDKIHAVILTAIPKEYEAVKAHLENIERYPNFQCDVAIFKGSGGNFRIAIAQTGRTNAEAQAKTMKMISQLKPQLAVFVGVAGGIKDDVSIGDVIVCTHASLFESGKLQDSGFMARPKIKESTPRLIDLARNLSDKSWTGRIKTNYQNKKPVVYVEPVASGDKLIIDMDSVEISRIKNYYNDSYAVEMEGYGFLLACAYENQTDKVLIRGISDKIDNKVDADQGGSQEIASAHAAAFAFEIIDAELSRIHQE